jgi:hypothetical protein
MGPAIFIRLSHLNPVDLIELIESAINKYYDKTRYPIDKEAKWEKVYPEVKRPLIKIVDKLLGFKTS